MIAIKENCKLRDLPYDTCLQNELPEEANQVFSIAPGEGNKSIPLLTDTLFEELANPENFRMERVDSQIQREIQNSH